jgi:long-chain acyl-CoA synthetase
VDLRQAWSCAEFGGYICMAGPDDPAHTVGQALPGLEVRVAGQGELCVRSSPFPTGEAWLRTGDLGRVDSNGRIELTGRLDEVIVLDDGQEVQPAQLEGRLKASPYVADAIVVGEARPHLGCLVVLDREAIEQWAQKRQVPFSDMRSLCESPEVGTLMADEVERLLGVQSPTIRAIQPIDLAADGNPRLYTPALALRRISVLEQFAPAVEGLWRPASI